MVLTKVVLSWMSNIALDNRTRNTISIAILRMFVDWEEASVVTLRADGDGNLRVVVRLQNFAGLAHVV